MMVDWMPYINEAMAHAVDREAMAALSAPPSVWKTMREWLAERAAKRSARLIGAIRHLRAEHPRG